MLSISCGVFLLRSWTPPLCPPQLGFSSKSLQLNHLLGIQSVTANWFYQASMLHGVESFTCNSSVVPHRANPTVKYNFAFKPVIYWIQRSRGLPVSPKDRNKNLVCPTAATIQEVYHKAAVWGRRKGVFHKDHLKCRQNRMSFPKAVVRKKLLDYKHTTMLPTPP